MFNTLIFFERRPKTVFDERVQQSIKPVLLYKIQVHFMPGRQNFARKCTL